MVWISNARVLAITERAVGWGAPGTHAATASISAAAMKPPLEDLPCHLICPAPAPPARGHLHSTDVVHADIHARNLLTADSSVGGDGAHSDGVGQAVVVPYFVTRNKPVSARGG